MRRYLLLSSALLIASLGAASTADAASSKGCRALVAKDKSKIVVRGKTSLVARRGTLADYNLTYKACLYSKPRLYKLRSDGATERYARFTLAGNFMAYAHTDVEEASAFYPSWIELVDLKRRVQVYQHDAYPAGPSEETAAGIPQILLRTDGAVAWIATNDTSDPSNYSVQTILPSQANPAEVDRGPDVGPTSLRRSVQSADVFSWERGGVRKEAAYGGPTVTP
ncbi:MAG: hypothetical protein QOH61_2414 [Chloroflexota bacterium]|nr:hypothetical protein [Chloroflexota bacterium]